MKHILKKGMLVLICIYVTVIFSSCNHTTEPVSISDFKLNTYITITVYDKIDISILNNCLDLCEYYENIFSRTRDKSQLSQVNNQEISEIEGDLATLIQYGIDYGNLTNGNFDITIGELSSLWNFTAAEPKVPSDDLIQDNLKGVNYQLLSLEKKVEPQDTYILRKPLDTKIDLGALAKGYIADKIKEYLLNQGVGSAVINLGGNILCIGNKPDGSPFHIGVQKPFSSNETLLSLNISDKSVVSSGTYERYFTVDGNFYHHILNPKTGYPYDTSLTSVTIISDSSTQGDCLSTSCFTLGLDKGMELIESLDGVEAIFVTDNGKIYYSKNAKNYIN